MSEYSFHWRPAGAAGAARPSVNLDAESHFHGAALALRKFVELGCDIGAPLAHVDITESNGVKQTLLVEEVLDWLNEPKQVEFVQGEGLAVLLQGRAEYRVPVCAGEPWWP